MSKLSLILIGFFASTAFAKVEIRVPILLHTSVGNEVYNISEFGKELAQKKIEIPNFVSVQKLADTDALDEIGRKIDDAQLEKPAGNPLYMELYGRVSSYQGANINYPICYRKVDDVTDQKAMEEAYELISNLTDSVLSDQYVIAAARFYGGKKFSGQDEKWLLKYNKTILKPGDIQIIATTNDSGDDDDEDILSLCE